MRPMGIAAKHQVPLILLVLLVLSDQRFWTTVASNAAFVASAFVVRPTSEVRIQPRDGYAYRRTSILALSAGVQEENNEQEASPDALPSNLISPSRRDFLKRATTTAVSSAAAVTASSFLGGRTALAAEEAVAEVVAPGAAPAIDAAGAATSLQLPPLGLGAWSWGDSLFWGYDSKNDKELNDVFDYAVTASRKYNTSLLLDTAEIYGFGRSEKLIGEFSKAFTEDSKIQVATKFAALPIRTSAKDVVKACKASLKRLNLASIDLYQLHFPNAWSNAAYWDGLAVCYDEGLVKAVGVSNYGVDATKACHDALAKRGIPLATNQIQYSLLYRYPEIDNGLLECCNDLGVKVLSYSPLALGMLAGKYTLEKPPQGPRKALYEKLMSTPDYENLLNIMRDVAAVHGPDATVAQVALNWCRAKNTIPIPGARTLRQIQSNYDSLGWIISDAEVRALDVAASKVTTFLSPDVSPFPKEDIQTHLKMFDS